MLGLHQRFRKPMNLIHSLRHIGHHRSTSATLDFESKAEVWKRFLQNRCEGSPSKNSNLFRKWRVCLGNFPFSKFQNRPPKSKYEFQDWREEDGKFFPRCWLESGPLLCPQPNKVYCLKRMGNHFLTLQLSPECSTSDSTAEVPSLHLMSLPRVQLQWECFSVDANGMLEHLLVPLIFYSLYLPSFLRAEWDGHRLIVQSHLQEWPPAHRTGESARTDFWFHGNHLIVFDQQRVRGLFWR